MSHGYYDGPLFASSKESQVACTDFVVILKKSGELSWPGYARQVRKNIGEKSDDVSAELVS